MPIHDWTQVEAGDFHAFHELWNAILCIELNAGLLPPGYFALLDQVAGGPPKTRIVERAELERYAKKANRIVVRHRRGKVIAVVEIVSPGNKGSRHALRTFVDKATLFLEQGVHLLVVDLFPPSKRDPQGIHRAIWEEVHDTQFKLAPGKPLTLAAYSAGLVLTAYVEPVAVGDKMRDMPLFLDPERHIPTPLEATYQKAWATFPQEMRDLLE